jgi:hypothetical protein
MQFNTAVETQTIDANFSGSVTLERHRDGALVFTDTDGYKRRTWNLDALALFELLQANA